VFNIGLGKSTSINQLYEMIKNTIGTDIEPKYEDARAGEIKHSYADISKARSIGYLPKDDFEDDLSDTINSLKN
jgi:UDP-glucose 4-epimerase